MSLGSVVALARTLSYYWKETDEVDIKKSLINVDDCVLIIVDVQDHFLARLPPQRAEQLVNRVGWLMEVAKILNVPMIVTAEEGKRYAGLTAVLAEKLPPGTKVLDKTVYGLADQTNILDAVRKTGRRTAVLVGMETDVCVTHSTIGLMQNGFQVVVLADVTDSPGDAHVFGLERMRGAGALVMSLKGLYYEWIRTVSVCNMMDDEHLKRIGHPNGIIL
jgi:nicotinamidase-related amidase